MDSIATLDKKDPTRIGFLPCMSDQAPRNKHTMVVGITARIESIISRLATLLCTLSMSSWFTVPPSVMFLHIVWGKCFSSIQTMWNRNSE